MNVFCWLYNLRDDYIISVDVNMYCCVLWPPPGPKTGMDFWGQVWKRVWKMTIFWSKVGSGLVEPGVVHPYQEFPGVASPGNMKESTNPISQPSSIRFLKSYFWCTNPIPNNSVICISPFLRLNGRFCAFNWAILFCSSERSYYCGTNMYLFIIDSGFRISGFRQTQKETSRYLADKILFNASLICQISTIIEFYLCFERLVCKKPCGNLPWIHFLKQQKYGNKIWLTLPLI